MTILELFFVCPNECSTLHWWTKQKLYRQFGGVLCGHASIIMLLKVAAMVDKVAADLCFRASKVRWLLPEKYFDFAANSAAGLLLDDNINNLRRIVRRSRSFDRKEIRTSSGAQGTSLYIIGVLNTQRFCVFVLNI